MPWGTTKWFKNTGKRFAKNILKTNKVYFHAHLDVTEPGDYNTNNNGSEMKKLQIKNNFVEKYISSNALIKSNKLILKRLWHLLTRDLLWFYTSQDFICSEPVQNRPGNVVRKEGIERTEIGWK